MLAPSHLSSKSRSKGLTVDHNVGYLLFVCLAQLQTLVLEIFDLLDKLESTLLDKNCQLGSVVHAEVSVRVEVLLANREEHVRSRTHDSQHVLVAVTR